MATALVSPAVWGTEFFIAPAGSDSNSGTQAKPFATLERVRDAIRELKKAGPLKSPVNVRLQGGTYVLSSEVRFGAEDSGTADCPITYTAAGPEPVVLDGGRRITGWKRHNERLSQYADPLFVAPEQGDFSLKPDSPAFALGFQPIDLSEMGPRVKVGP